MPRLCDLQQAFAEAIVEGKSHAVAGAMAEDGRALRSVALYRRLIRNNYVQVLKVTYPVLSRFVGRCYFEVLARGYLRRHPSTSGDLFLYGRHLPLFLLTLEAPRLLVELARLEWACHEVYQAADASPLSCDQFDAIASADPSRATFRLKPTARLLRCSMPVHRLWQALQPDASSDDEIALPLPEEDTGILVARADGRIHVTGLAAHEYRLLEAMADRKTVADIERLASDPPAERDAGQFMSTILNARTLSAFSIEVLP